MDSTLNLYHEKNNAETKKYAKTKINKIPTIAIPDQKTNKMLSQNLNIKYRIKQVITNVINVSI